MNLIAIMTGMLRLYPNDEYELGNNVTYSLSHSETQYVVAEASKAEEALEIQDHIA